MFHLQVTRVSRRLKLPTAFDLDLSLTARGMTLVLIVLLGLFLWLAWGEWQGFVESAWVRLAIAFSVFLVPGFAVQQLLWRGADVSFSQRVVAGFGAAVGLTGVLGLLATALHVAMAFVIAGLSAVLILCVLGWAVRQGWQWQWRKQLEIRAVSILLFVPALVACALVARLTLRLVIEGDDLTYTAYVAHWLEAAHWDWQEIFFDAERLASSRFWLAYWTLDEALLARWSGVPAMELTRVYLAPFLGVSALAATYALARGLEFSRAWSSFSLTLQAAALLMLTGVNQPGLVWLNRQGEDKVVAAFLMAPLFVCVVTAFLKRHTLGRFCLATLIGAGLVLTHPTLMAITAVAVAVYVLLYGLAKREWRAPARMGLVLVLMMLAPLGIRLLDVTFTAKIPFDVGALPRSAQAERLLTWNEIFFVVNPQIVWGLPFAWVGLAGCVAAFQWRRRHVARWLVTGALILLSVINPLTAPLWGSAVSAIHVWRVVWILPFGIAAAFLVAAVGNFFLRRAGQQWSEWQRGAAIAAFALVCLLGVLWWMWESENFQAVNALHTNARQQLDYADLMALKPDLDAQLRQPTMLLGGNMWLNDRLPGVSANARVPAFRSALNMWLLSSIELEEARTRFQTLRNLYKVRLSVSERLAFLDTFAIRFVIAKERTLWLDELVAAAPTRFQHIETRGALKLYRVLPQ
jgi:hypothetical protein